MKKHSLLCTLAVLAAAIIPVQQTDACTNVIITKGASADGSCMVSYSADSHVLFGELYYHPAADWKAGSQLQVTEWDSYKPLGFIPQAAHTYQTVGNMNEHQLIIGETTWGGREEQMDPEGITDYGSLIYIALQRARTAREAIDVIVSLANEYGYPSEGETFSIADSEEAWIMDLCGKGAGNKGIVWVARRVPDGYICAHANQPRITTFPLNDPETLYATDVISFAREKGWFSGKDEEFSFRDAYCPLDFGTVRGCDARAWSAFNILGEGNFTYVDENGKEVTRPASDWLDYAMGYDLEGEMPLWIKPSKKVTPKAVADVMRDHFEGTPMDMTTDIGAGGNALPYRWRPMEFEYDGKTYVNERAIATQQTGFWFVAQARGYLPDEVGALIWFGCDDAATSYLTPIYASTQQVPECVRVGNGDMLTYSPTSQFWMCNRVANACYKMYDQMAPYVRAKADAFENDQMFTKVPQMDAKAAAAVKAGKIKDAKKMLTQYSVETAQKQFADWAKLEETLLVKFIDGNVKAQNEDGSFKHSEYHAGTPEGLTQPGYTDFWKEAVAYAHGDILEVKDSKGIFEAPAGNWRKSDETHRRADFPKVNDNGEFWFQYQAPATAKNVVLSFSGTDYPMMKDADGKWNIVLKSPKPGFQWYWFVVDGISVSDPGVYPSYVNGIFSTIDAPGAPGDEFYQMRDVPHGEVREHWFHSAVDGNYRRMYVYTPAEYEKNKNKKYPVLYLQHGAGEDETEWVNSGKAAIILDNLIAEGKAQPMIIVMNNDFVYKEGDAIIRLAMSEHWSENFEEMFINEVIPDIDSHYRTIADANHRAMAGLSLGGMLTSNIGLKRPDLFSYYGLLSGGVTDDLDSVHNGIMKTDAYKNVKLVFMSCGSEEYPERVAKGTEEVNKLGGKIKGVGYVSPGTAHEWQTWRRALHEFLPLLFK